MFGLMARRVPRILASAALLAAAGALAAPAAMAQGLQEFRGGGFISDFRNCDGLNPGGGIIPVTARYQPGELPGNDESSLTLSDGFTYSFNMRQVGGVFEDTFSPVRSFHLVPTPELIRPLPRLRVQRQIPDEIDEDTNRMRLMLRVRNLFDIQGCVGVVDLEMVRW